MAISINDQLTDHDLESPNEHGTHDDFGTVHLAPVTHTHEGEIEPHDHSQCTLKLRSSCIDDELYVTLDFNVSLVEDNAVHVEVRVRLYEGASCATEDKDTDRTFDLGEIGPGVTTPFLEVSVENENEGGDAASCRIVITNLHSDDCSGG